MNGNRRRDADPLIAFLLGLRTVRCFCPEPVPQQVIEDVLEVARWSGSAMNLQPWEFVVVWDREVLRDLASVEGYAGHLAGAAVGIVLVMAGERAEQETFDEGRLGERISLAAAAHGVGQASDGSPAAGGRPPKGSSGYPPNAWCVPLSPWGTPREHRRAVARRSGKDASRWQIWSTSSGTAGVRRIFESNFARTTEIRQVDGRLPRS